MNHYDDFLKEQRNGQLLAMRADICKRLKTLEPEVWDLQERLYLIDFEIDEREERGEM